MLVLIGVLAIALGWDRGVLTQISKVHTEDWEQSLLGHFQPKAASSTTPGLSIEEMPELNGATAWLNSKPLLKKDLVGKVVLIDFWTYSCINCLRSLPYIEAWAEKYKESGLVVIGVHTPEFAFEKNPANVEQAVRELKLTYPIAVDSDYSIWKSFHNEYWPAHYFIDATGKIRDHHFGEGDYAESEKTIQTLLKERGSSTFEAQPVQVQMNGVELQSGYDEESPETYVGYHRAKNMVLNPTLQPDVSENYLQPKSLDLNQWSLVGEWKIQAENAVLTQAPGKIIFRFHSRDLHLVLGPGEAGQELHFKVRLDGKPPGESHGLDVDPSGLGVVKENRLYQLIRQNENVEIQDHTFEIEFQDLGAKAFAFTFG